MDRPDAGNRPGGSLDDVLNHYGVKGMHWGVRKRRSDSGPTSSDATKAKTHAATVKAHGTKALTNKELQDLVTRMNLEQQFSNLSAKQKQDKSAKAIIKSTLQAGRTINDVIQFVNSPAGKQIKKLFDR
jgi:hypothetical protein